MALQGCRSRLARDESNLSDEMVRKPRAVEVPQMREYADGKSLARGTCVTLHLCSMTLHLKKRILFDGSL